MPPLRPAALVAASILGLALASPALAVTVDTVGDTWKVRFGGNVAGSDVPGLTVEAHFLVLDLTGNELTLQIDLSNTSDPTVWKTARVSAIGFDTDPTLTGAEMVSGIFGHAHTGGSFPNGFGRLDFCANDNKNNCQGGRSGGLKRGESGPVVTRLLFDDDLSSVVFSNFGVRYQSLGSGELGIFRASGTGVGVVASPMPEPGTGLLFGIGALALTRLLRR